MSVVHSRMHINGLVLPNRLMRSAIYEALADASGRPTFQLANLMRDFSLTGLAVAGSCYVTPSGRKHPHETGLVTSAQLSSWRVAIDAIHESDGRICLQLHHAGLESLPGTVPEGPSAAFSTSRAMSASDIKRVIDAFVRAGINAHSVGADAVELHASRGYLLGQFLSPVWNRRSDEFGGSTIRRFEIVRRILSGLRKTLPRSYPILLKINGSDVEPDGVPLETAVETAVLAEAAGADALEVNGGRAADPCRQMQRTLLNRRYCREIKKAVKIPVISVGGFRRFEDIESVLNAGDCDMVSLSRPFIRNRDLVSVLRPGWKSSCSNCNQCFSEAFGGRGLRCVAPYEAKTL
jgi:2,4-dienoyl-CoA reductase-like NADH-dependent reductase (Old Yellow Enzyme family)